MKKLLFLFLLITRFAQAAPLPTVCSATPLAAKLNEIKTQGGGQQIRFIEVLIMGIDVNIGNWEIGYASRNGVNTVQMGQNQGQVHDGAGNLLGTDGPGGAGTVFSYPTFITYEISPMNPNWGEIILRDTTSNQVPVPGLTDYLAYSTDSTCTAHQWEIPSGGCVSSSCVSWDSHNSDISRDTDGTGAWVPDLPNSPTAGESNAEPSQPGEKMLLNFTFFPNSGSFCTNTPVQITLQARDTSGAIKTNYTGTVRLTSTSGIGNGNYVFTAQDAGQKVIALTDPYEENITLSVADVLIPGTASTSGVMGFHHCVGGFNAYESATPAGSISGVLKTRISGNPIGLDLIAINVTGNAIDSGFNNDVRVELLGNLSLGVPLDSNRCPISFTVLQSSTRHISSGRSTVSLDAVSDAWRDVRVRIGFPAGSPTTYSCSSDDFAIRPAFLGDALATDSDSSTAGLSRILANSAAAGGVVHRAGRYFSIRATARNSAGAITSNYSGSPSVQGISCTLPSPCSNGILTPGTFGGNGTVETDTARYSEAGALFLTLEDATFASVDASDSSPAERTIPQSPAPLAVGRFVPDHFTLSSSVDPLFLTFNDATCPSRSFTYIGQPFGYAVLPQAQVAAKSASGTTTVNYSGSLWKLTANDILQNYSGTPAPDASGIAMPSLSSNSNGTGNYSANSADRLVFPRSVPAVPFDASIALAVSASDSSENAVPGNGIISTQPPYDFDGSGSGIDFDSGNRFVYGRIYLPNAHGSELAALPVAMETQYYNGIGFVTNMDDQCTIVSSGSLALSNYQKNLDPGETAPAISGRFQSGKSNLTFSAPGLGNSGSVDLCIDLDSAAGNGDTSCQAPIPANLGYLQGRGSASLYDRDPGARATFGVYGNVNEFIYFRENY